MTKIETVYIYLDTKDLLTKEESEDIILWLKNTRIKDGTPRRTGIEKLKNIVLMNSQVLVSR